MTREWPHNYENIWHWPKPLERFITYPGLKTLEVTQWNNLLIWYSASPILFPSLESEALKCSMKPHLHAFLSQQLIIVRAMAILCRKIHTEEERDSLLSTHHKGRSSNSGKRFSASALEAESVPPDTLTNDAALRNLHSFLRLHFLTCEIENNKTKK